MFVIHWLLVSSYYGLTEMKLPSSDDWLFSTIVLWTASMNTFLGHAVLMTNVALRLEYVVLRLAESEEPCGCQVIWFVLRGKAVLTVFMAYTEPMSFVSMLTGAPTCNVFHLKLRDVKKDVTNSSRIELHHHSSTLHKGLLLTFQQTGLKSLLLKHYKTITTYAYVMCNIPPFFLSSLFLSQAHFFVSVFTTLSYCTCITLQKHCTVFLSCCLLACHRHHLRYISVFTCI